MLITRVEVVTNFKTDFMKELNSMLRRVHDDQRGHAARVLIKDSAHMSTLLIKFAAHGFQHIRQYVEVLVAKMYNDRDVI